MNIITADFNWISLIIIVGGAIFSIIKSIKKDDSKPIVQNVDFETEDEYEHEHMFESIESDGDKYTTTSNIGQQIQSVEEVISKKEEEYIYNLKTEEKNQFKFDLRQAIISSEILRRPEY